MPWWIFRCCSKERERKKFHFKFFERQFDSSPVFSILFPRDKRSATLADAFKTDSILVANYFTLVCAGRDALNQHSKLPFYCCLHFFVCMESFSVKKLIVKTGAIS
jgi:hypothetical protein